MFKVAFKLFCFCERTDLSCLPINLLFIVVSTLTNQLIVYREFFERQAGCDTTIEFFKQSDMDDSLYVALKFDTREIAKDILNRYVVIQFSCNVSHSVVVNKPKFV